MIDDTRKPNASGFAEARARYRPPSSGIAMVLATGAGFRGSSYLMNEGTLLPIFRLIVFSRWTDNVL